MITCVAASQKADLLRGGVGNTLTLRNELGSEVSLEVSEGQLQQVMSLFEEERAPRAPASSELTPEEIALIRQRRAAAAQAAPGISDEDAERLAEELMSGSDIEIPMGELARPFSDEQPQGQEL